MITTFRRVKPRTCSSDTYNRSCSCFWRHRLLITGRQKERKKKNAAGGKCSGFCVGWKDFSECSDPANPDVSCQHRMPNTVMFFHLDENAVLAHPFISLPQTVMTQAPRRRTLTISVNGCVLKFATISQSGIKMRVSIAQEASSIPSTLACDCCWRAGIYGHLSYMTVVSADEGGRQRHSHEYWHDQSRVFSIKVLAVLFSSLESE